MEEYRGVWVYSETPALAYELLGKGRELSNTLETELAAICLGHEIKEGCKDLIAQGADKVYFVDSELLANIVVEPYTDAIVSLVEAHRPEILLIGATKKGLELAPRVAERLKTGLCTECVKLEVDAEKRFVLMERLVLGGNLTETQIIKRKPQMATIPKGVFRQLPRDDSRKGEAVQAQAKINESPVKVVDIKPKQAAGIKISEADIIVSFGRGVRKKEDVKIIEELAKAIGAVLGCSRPIAEDLKWMPTDLYIGLSGQKVNPKLYIACGISGQIQHITGMRNSRLIVAINSDSKAPIFEFSDYGIVGDLYQVVPALTDAFKRISQ